MGCGCGRGRVNHRRHQHGQSESSERRRGHRRLGSTLPNPLGTLQSVPMDAANIKYVRHRVRMEGLKYEGIQSTRKSTIGQAESHAEESPT